MSGVPGSVSGAVALVTGAATGIGRATACLLAAEGAKAVAVTDRDGDGAMAVVAEIEANHPGVASAHKLDVTDPARWAEVLAVVQARRGGLTCAVNNAGTIGSPTPLATMTDEQWNDVVRVNPSGTFFGLRVQLPAIAATGGGAIVNVSSAVVRGAIPDFSAYASTKFGVEGLTRAAASEHASAGVRVNAVQPGLVWTPMLSKGMSSHDQLTTAASPLGRYADPSEIAQAIVWLCSSRASYITGTSLLVDGGRHEFMS